MPNLRKTACPKGHPYNAKNTGWKKTQDGGDQQVCKRCISAKQMKRYHSDPAYAERKIRNAREWRARQKAPCPVTPGGSI